MSVPVPVILIPSGGVDYFTDRLDHFISGTVDVDVTSVKYKFVVSQLDITPVFPATFYETGIVLNISTNPSATTSSWSFRTSKLPETLNVGDRLYLQFFAFTDTEQSTESEIKVTFISETVIAATVETPSGISIERFNTHLKIIPNYFSTRTDRN